MTIQMTTTDVRDLLNHSRMFGPLPFVKKSAGNRWTVSFRSFGYPGYFRTKGAAITWAREWVMALAHRAQPHTQGT